MREKRDLLCVDNPKKRDLLCVDNFLEVTPWPSFVDRKARPLMRKNLP